MAKHFRTVIVDGYNVLLSFAEREGVEFRADDLREGRDALARALDRWAHFVDTTVLLVWDTGRLLEQPAPENTERVKISYVAPPAEADDWIVCETQRRISTGDAVAVVSRDKGLWRRLPREVERVTVDGLFHDFLAMDGDVLHAPHLGSSKIHVSEEEFRRAESIDTRLLPRRLPHRALSPDARGTARVQPHIDRNRQAGHHATSASPVAAANDEAKKTAEEKKNRRRSRYQRAQARKALARKAKRKKP